MPGPDRPGGLPRAARRPALGRRADRDRDRARAARRPRAGARRRRRPLRRQAVLARRAARAGAPCPLRCSPPTSRSRARAGCRSATSGPTTCPSRSSAPARATESTRRLCACPHARPRSGRAYALPALGGDLARKMFRDAEQFQLLERVLLPRCSKTAAGSPPGRPAARTAPSCYTLGIVLERLGAIDRALLLGSDLLDENLALARAGAYDGYDISEHVRARMRWEQRDLVADGPPRRPLAARDVPQRRDLPRAARAPRAVRDARIGAGDARACCCWAAASGCWMPRPSGCARSPPTLTSACVDEQPAQPDDRARRDARARRRGRDGGAADRHQPPARLRRAGAPLAGGDRGRDADRHGAAGRADDTARLPRVGRRDLLPTYDKVRAQLPDAPPSCRSSSPTTRTSCSARRRSATTRSPTSTTTPTRP